MGCEIAVEGRDQIVGAGWTGSLTGLLAVEHVDIPLFSVLSARRDRLVEEEAHRPGR